MSNVNQVIRDAVLQRITQQNQTASALDLPGAHIVLPGDDNKAIQILVKSSNTASTTDTADTAGFDAYISGVGNARRGGLEVSRTDDVDLGELGQWHCISIAGFDPTMNTVASAQPLRLNVLSKVVEGLDPAQPFYASMDLALALHLAESGEYLLVRPVEEGERGGQNYVALPPDLRLVMQAMVKHPVDDVESSTTVSAAVSGLNETKRQQHALESSAAAAGLISLAVSLDVNEQQNSLPQPWVDFSATPETETPSPSGLSGEAHAYLADRGNPPPAHPTEAWVEGALNGFTAATPAAVVASVRELYVRLQDSARTLESDLFGDLMGEVPPPEPQATIIENSALQQSRAYKTQQFKEGLAGLEVDRQTARKLAMLMADALQPRDRPAAIIISGPRHSAADKMLELAQAMVGESPLLVGRDDLADAGFASVYGVIAGGVPTGPDGILAEARVAAHRDTPMSHAAIVVTDLDAVGCDADPADRAAIQENWLMRVADMMRTGKARVYAKAGTGTSEERTVELRNVVFLMRSSGDSTQLDKLLAGNQALAPLRRSRVEAKSPTADASVNFLEQWVNANLSERGVLPEATVTLSGNLRTALKRAYTTLGSIAAFELFSERLLNECVDGIQASGSMSVSIDWSRRLTAKETRRLETGKSVPFAPRYFDLTPDGEPDSKPLEFAENIEVLRRRADRAQELTAEVNRLRAQLAVATGSSDTV